MFSCRAHYVIPSPFMSARRTAPLLPFLALFATPALAAEPPPPITARLEYAAPRGCPPASVLGAEFARRMGYDPFVESSPLRLVATIVREKNTLAGSMPLYDSAGTQVWTKPLTFPAWQCLVLVQFMAGALVVRFDPKML